MYIFLDDVRKPPDGWILVQDIESLINIFECYQDKVKRISLDHDLGIGYKTGYDFRKWLEEKVFNNKIDYIPRFSLHTANPVGRDNMAKCLNRIRKYLDNK